MVSNVPQIRCPNCGLTISLENRKETDVDLITRTVRGGVKSFTQLLRTTKLPRKTLSLRLKELCEDGALVKRDGGYALNGHYSRGKLGGYAKFSSISSYRKMGPGIALILLLLGSPIAAQVLAAFLAPSPIVQGPVILGSFDTVISIDEVSDLYAWQVVIAFNPDELEVLEITSGDFVGDEFPTFVHSVRDKDGFLVLGGTMLGPVAGRDGGGILASVVFGYLVEDYTSPSIVYEGERFETVLLDSQFRNIPITSEVGLTLSFEEP